MRMPAHELVVAAPSHLLEVALAFLLEQAREKVDLEEKVAELVQLLGRVPGEYRVGYLVSLLDRVWNDRGRGLLAIPGTVDP